MKVRWWQDGIHVEPETDREREALVVLFRALNVEAEAEATPQSGNAGEDSERAITGRGPS